MGTSLKLSDDLVDEARHEAEAADRSLTSQIEHWARLGRSVESALRHEDVLALKRTVEGRPAPWTRRALLAVLRRIALDGVPTELSATLREGRTVYQDAGNGRVERIERDGTRTGGRFVNRHFMADEPKPAAGRR
ncbi:MAG TPA: hypothetical protein VEO74_00770 [Thermoanaerobaculia bacterium]|nr:hypothetical protein [Thermoanaerobaculia bacterium]